MGVCIGQFLLAPGEVKSLSLSSIVNDRATEMPESIDEVELLVSTDMCDDPENRDILNVSV